MGTAAWRSLFAVRSARLAARMDIICFTILVLGGSCHASCPLVSLVSCVFGGLVVGVVRSQAPAAASEDTGRSIAGGGITVPGWEGKVDAGAAKAGQTVKDAKLAPEGKGMRVTTGPAMTYWNPKNVAKGDYTVSATFNEPKFMNLNDHPHPYGIVIGGQRYGNGAAEPALLRGLWQRNVHRARIWAGRVPDGRQAATANDAVHKAAAVGQPVTQDIAHVGEGRYGHLLDQRDGGGDV